MHLKKIIHILPSDSIGGVETAAKTSNGIKTEKFFIVLKFLCKPSNKKDPITIIFSLFQIFISSLKIVINNPDFIIVSLWKSCLAALLIKVLNPKTKIILFLHLPRSLNFLDYLFSKIVGKLAYQVWGDSITTIKNRTKELGIDKAKERKIISFIRTKLVENAKPSFEPKFIFWGRFHSQKRIDLALKFFKVVSDQNKNSKFILIGPDCGKLKSLKELSKKLNLNSKVKFYNSMNINEIIEYSKESSFFLQLSSEEGLAMSVVESMQLGLIPIVTNVGEINNYCVHKENCLIYANIEATSKEVFRLINNPDEMIHLRNNAVTRWANCSTYREDLARTLDGII